MIIELRVNKRNGRADRTSTFWWSPGSIRVHLQSVRKHEILVITLWYVWPFRICTVYIGSSVACATFPKSQYPRIPKWGKCAGKSPRGGALPRNGVWVCAAACFSGQSALPSLPIYHQCAVHMPTPPPFSNVRKKCIFSLVFGQNYSSQEAKFPNIRSQDFQGKPVP